MGNPTVSFVVPCYKLAHLLPECVESILAQTYSNVEVLILDDCSPDNTMEVARTFTDTRISYVRNERNLGHLANYNKGIRLSRGEYVWLISADDRLRKPYIIERYVRCMEEHPAVGYVCCPGVGLQDGQETGVLRCGYYGPRDRIMNGPDFIALSLRRGYGLLSPSVMVRRQCYERIAEFPLDMPHQGDWYLWFRWALEHDVAYMAEPMVNYRSHDLNIMKDLVRRLPAAVFRDEVNVLWRIKHKCEQKGLHTLARKCEDVLTAKYARSIASMMYSDTQCHLPLTLKQCEQELLAKASGLGEYLRLRAKMRAFLGNQEWRHGDFHRARQTYALALKDCSSMPSVWAKLTLLRLGLGPAGMYARKLKRAPRWSVPTAYAGVGSEAIRSN
jgi:glycosyltransferase involved in cell wall biosynthesis